LFCNENCKVSGGFLCIERETLREGILSGKYRVMLWGPFVNFEQSRKKKIQKGIRDYIVHTQSDDKASLEMIIDEGIERCGIEKVSAEKNCLYNTFESFKWEEQARIEAYDLLKSVIKKKSLLLQDVPLPKILVLEDAYPFLECTQLDSDDIQRIVEEISTEDSTFETIFIVENYDRGHVIYGKTLAEYGSSKKGCLTQIP
jgi:hypothetical protein